MGLIYWGRRSMLRLPLTPGKNWNLISHSKPQLTSHNYWKNEGISITENLYFPGFIGGVTTIFFCNTASSGIRELTNDITASKQHFLIFWFLWCPHYSNEENPSFFHSSSPLMTIILQLRTGDELGLIHPVPLSCTSSKLTRKSWKSLLTVLLANQVISPSFPV